MEYDRYVVAFTAQNCQELPMGHVGALSAANATRRQLVLSGLVGVLERVKKQS